ncbi:unnamed protein product [Allacma fusca]|uniref:Sialin n=1 Tax=Allacma fusca TaxID=39272 RepID=A0A8J2PD41_9HEXA|nr:unnamed protein product [Allacma fusca]
MAIVAMTNSSMSTQEERVPIFKVDQCPHMKIPDEQEQWKSLKIHSIQIDDENGNSSGRMTIALGRGAQKDPNEEQANKDEASWSTNGEFSWDEEEQGIILGSFFWGYILTQLPGGYLGQRFGGKWPLGIGLLTTAIFTLLTPFAANMGKEALIACRIIQGLGEGVTMPSMHAMLAVWVPIEERSKLSAAVYAGMSLGTSIIMTLSGYITHYFGWPVVFYASGALAIIWFVFWAMLIYDTPNDHPRISADELDYISASLFDNTWRDKEKKPPTPWRSILVSVPFWGILLCQTLETWGMYTLLHEIPTYMKTVLRFDMQQNCLLSAFPHLLSWVVTIVVTQIGDWLIERNFVSVVTVRKSCNTIGLWGSAAAMLGVAYSGCDRTATTVLLSLAMGAYGSLLGGVIINLIDIAPNYASILMGVTNTFATLSGFGAPWMAGYILKGNPSLENWRIVFIVAAAICFVGNLIYILMASGKEQKWNRGENEKDGKEVACVNQQIAINWVIQNPSDLEQQIDRMIALEDVPHFPRNSA